MNDKSERTNFFFRSAWVLLGSAFALAAAPAAEISDELPIEIQNTRVVFNEGEPSSVVSVRNKSNIPYLVAVDIMQYCGEGQTCPSSEDFMTSPGVKVISPGQSFPFRIVKLADNLPADKESLYLVHFRLLPSEVNLSDKDLDSSRVTIAIAGSMKLFWRPAALANTSGVLKVRDMLAAHCSDGNLEMINRSAYWGTFGTLQASGQTLLKDGPLPMVAPFSSVHFPIGTCPQSVSISFIAESGLLTAARTVLVQAQAPE